MQIYADDISVFIEGYEYDKLIEIMNNETKKVDIWLQANGLVINLEKTHYSGRKRNLDTSKRRKKFTAKQGIKFHIPLSLLSLCRV